MTLQGIIDRLKNTIIWLKNTGLYILGPIIGLLGYLYYLKEKVNNLNNQLRESKEDKALAATLATKRDEENEANNKENDYATLRDKYYRENGIWIDPNTQPKSKS